ncbi:MAG: hypothetical protein V3S83_12480 [Gemmatimonadota bacterium]
MSSYDENIAWAAGFFEGDAGIFIDKRGRVTLEAEQVDPRVLYRMAGTLGGYVTLRGTRDVWRWRLSAEKGVLHALNCLRPHMDGPKLLQLTVARDRINGRTPVDQARRALWHLKGQHVQAHVQGS